MATDKTRSVQVRLSNETIEYLGEIQKKNGLTLCGAIRKIIEEREIKDRMSGSISAFDYQKGPTARGQRSAEDAPHIAGPVPAPLRGDVSAPTRAHKTESHASVFSEAEKIVFNGTITEWESIPPELRAKMTYKPE